MVVTILFLNIGLFPSNGVRSLRINKIADENISISLNKSLT